MTTRRTFLRVLGSAIIGIAAAPTGVVPAVVDTPKPSWWGAQNATSNKPLTFEMIEQAYREARIGSTGPNMMIVSSSQARLIGLVYDVEIAV